MTGHPYDHHYWVGYLANTVAVATIAPEPQPVLRSALREFLADHPKGDALGDLIRAAMGGKP